MTISRTATVPSVQAISLRERSCRMVKLVIRFFFFRSLVSHRRSDATIPVSSKERQQSAFQEKVMTKPRDLIGNRLTILSHNEGLSLVCTRGLALFLREHATEDVVLF